MAVMTEKKYEVTIKKTMLYPRAGEMAEALSKLPSGNLLPVPILFQIGNLGKVEFYAESIDANNGIGYLDTKANTLTEDDFLDFEDKMQHGSTFTIQLKSVSGNTFLADAILKEPTVKATATSCTVEDAIKRVVEEGIMSQEQADANLAILRAHQVSDTLISKVFARCKTYEKPAHKAGTIFVDAYRNRTDPESRIIANTIRCIETGSAVIYEGDRSVGKNVCAETMAQLLNMPYYLITFNKRMSSEDIYGAKTTDNSASQMLTADRAEAYMGVMRGSTSDAENLKKAIEFQLYQAKAASINIVQEASQFVEWLLGGGVMVLNEMNLSDPNFFASIFNQLLDGTKFIYVPGYGRVDVNPDCIIIGTQNKACYAGVSQQNNATMSRFGCLVFDFPDSIRKQLKEAIGSKFVVDTEYYQQTDHLYRQFKKIVDSGTIGNECLNIRGFIRAIEAFAIDPTSTKLSAQIMIHVVNTCPEDSRRELAKQVEEFVTL